METKISYINEVNDWLAKANRKGLLDEQGINKNLINYSKDLIYPDSICSYGQVVFALAKMESQNTLLVFNDNSLGFSGHYHEMDNKKIYFCPANHKNASRLREIFPFTAPSILKNEMCTFGMGDRLDLASPGHLRIIDKYNAAPVLAQQSARELELTNRTYADAIDSASWAVFQEGYHFPWGADGDHLKTEKLVKKAIEMGCTMITADVSDYIYNKYALADEDSIQKDYKNLENPYRERIEKKYLGAEYRLDTDEIITFTPGELSRVALIYKDAIEFTEKLYRVCLETGEEIDFEVSIDETEVPTLPGAHIFVVEELIRKNIDFISMAPRFVGEFQKGIDYIGNIDSFKKSICTHASISRYFGNYKISVHSGSDKFSVFPFIGKETKMQFHIKTSGTSWLETLLVIANKAPQLFRTIYNLAKEVYPAASKYYHVTPDFDNLTGIDQCDDNDLYKVLENPNDRRVLHIAYGELLKNQLLKKDLFKTLKENKEEYWIILGKHFKNHLDTLGVELKGEKPLENS